MDFVPFNFINDVTDQLPYFELKKTALIGSSWSAEFHHQNRCNKTPLNLRVLVYREGLSCSLHELTDEGKYKRSIGLSSLQNVAQELIYLTITTKNERNRKQRQRSLTTDTDYEALLHFLVLQNVPLERTVVTYAHNLPEENLLGILNAVNATSVLELSGTLSFGNILGRAPTINCNKTVPYSVESTILDFIKTGHPIFLSGCRNDDFLGRLVEAMNKKHGKGQAGLDEMWGTTEGSVIWTRGSLDVGPRTFELRLV